MYLTDTLWRIYLWSLKTTPQYEVMNIDIQTSPQMIEKLVTATAADETLLKLSQVIIQGN